MLLPIREETPRCAIFRDLNTEVIYFLNAAVKSNRFTRNMISNHLRDALWDNQPTKKMFNKLWVQIKPLSEAKRNRIYQEARKKQFLQHYYEDTNYKFPSMPGDVKKALGKLCKHLFEHSTKLAGVRDSCGETLHESFAEFRNYNNNICCFCASAELAQVRAGADENDQWRSANDHLLSKSEYPEFAVHPDNLVPLCETCNSKAKLAKDLLNWKQKDKPDVRRRCFFPFTESCHEYVGVVLDRGELGLRAQFIMSPDSPETEEKLNTWNDVYQIQSRIEGKFIKVTSLIDSDCPANNLVELKQKIHEKADTCDNHVRTEVWNFWKCRLYQWLDTTGGPILNELWSSIEDNRADADAAAVFGI